MVQGLPPRGAYYQAVNGHGWDDLEYLLAQLVDDVRRIPGAIYRGAGAKNVQDPKPMKRPGQSAAGRIGDRGDRSVEEVVAWLDSLSATTRTTT